MQSLTEEDWQALRQATVAMLEQYLQHKQAEMNVSTAGAESDVGAED
ncbi:hypothetical protein [Chroococcidiopsis sp. CCMEE 29]|nr:hypothetical protein [Chroococcidiopsis sp. CCMEE 29]